MNKIDNKYFEDWRNDLQSSETKNKKKILIPYWNQYLLKCGNFNFIIIIWL